MRHSRQGTCDASGLPPVLLAGACLVWGCLAWACAGLPQFDDEAQWPPPRSGMVVCEHPLATAVGVRILEEGGNAADAAVATALALAVVHPQSGNLGGGGFAVWVAHDPDPEPEFIDFREVAPAALTPALFLDQEGQRVPARSLEGGLAVGVPGSPAGLYELQRRHGRLSFEDVVAPAVALAREGYAVDRWMQNDLDANADKLLRSEGARALFQRGEGMLREGDEVLVPELAETLERYGQQGPAAIYQGVVAERIVEEVQAAGGVLTLQDLADYRVAWREPLRGWFRGLEIVTAPPPSSGGVALLQVLSMLDGFPLDEERVLVRADDPQDRVGLSGRALHWWVESMRLAFAERAEYLGDPDFFEVPVEALLSPQHINTLRVRIGELANPNLRPLSIPLAEEGGETTHLSVLDSEGNAVSLTTTLNTYFGSGLLVRGTGILLNSQIDDFAIVPGSPNEYGLVGGAANALVPGKRPLSSMTPMVVRDGGRVVKYVLGSPGGPRIITSVLEVLLRTVVYGQDLETSVAAPRVHQQWSPSRTLIEPDCWDELLLQGLRNNKHEIETATKPWGGVQAISVEVGEHPVGVSDWRRGGSAGRAVAARPD